MVNPDFPADPPETIDDDDDTVPGSADPPVEHQAPGFIDPLPGQQVDDAQAGTMPGAPPGVEDDMSPLDIETSAMDAVPTLPPPEPSLWEPVDLAPPVLDIETSAMDAVPTLPVPPDDSSSSPNPAQEIGHALAAHMQEMAVPADRPAAARDLVHEMIEAGAEDEITPDLLRAELPPEPFTDADYAAYDAEIADGEQS